MIAREHYSKHYQGLDPENTRKVRIYFNFLELHLHLHLVKESFSSLISVAKDNKKSLNFTLKTKGRKQKS